MAKPIVVAKSDKPEWCVLYEDADTGETESMSVYGSPTIEDALTEARASLDGSKTDYTIVGIELVDEEDVEGVDTDEP